MERLDHILDIAISELGQGHTPEEVLNMYPEYRNELAPLLSVVSETITLPRRDVPSPRKQYKFITQQTKLATTWSWTSLVNILKFSAFPLSLLLALTGTIAAAHFVQTSLPGQPFFAVKKATEQIPVAFTKSTDQAAQIQLALTQKRIEEAETIIKSEHTADEQKIAALNELSSQTKNTLATVQAATQSTAPALDNSSLLTSLDQISKQQEALVAEVSKNDTTSTTSSPIAMAAQETSNDVANIKQIIAAASESSLTTLPISLTGTVTSITATTITVDKTVFTLSDKTVILKNEVAATTQFIKEKMLVRVTGDKVDETFLAKEIVLLDNSAESSSKEKQTKKVTPTTNTNPTPIQNTELQTPIQEPILKAGFIPEDPAPQVIR